MEEGSLPPGVVLRRTAQHSLDPHDGVTLSEAPPTRPRAHTQESEPRRRAPSLLPTKQVSLRGEPASACDGGEALGLQGAPAAPRRAGFGGGTRGVQLRWEPGRGLGAASGREGLCSRGGGPGLPSSASGGGRGVRGARRRATARPWPGAREPEEGEDDEEEREEAAAGSCLILPGSAGSLAAAGWGWPRGAGPGMRCSCRCALTASWARSRVVSGRRPRAPHAPRGGSAGGPRGGSAEAERERP